MPPSVVTVDKLTGPAALPGGAALPPAWYALSLLIGLAMLPPKVTFALLAVPRLAPEIVTEVPPATAPALGVMPLMFGAAK